MRYGAPWSAPTVQTPEFPGTVEITGAFTEDEVRDLVRIVNRGSFATG